MVHFDLSPLPSALLSGLLWLLFLLVCQKVFSSVILRLAQIFFCEQLSWKEQTTWLSYATGKSIAFLGNLASRRRTGGQESGCAYLRGYRSVMLSSLRDPPSSLEAGSQKAVLWPGSPSPSMWSSLFFFLCNRQAGTYSTPCF